MDHRQVRNLPNTNTENTMTKKDRILASIAKNPTAPNYKIAKNLGLRVSEVDDVRRQSPVAVTPTTKTGKTLDAFRTQHDVAFIIDAHTRTHLSDRSDVYYTDHEFREICGIPSSNWRRFADDTRFAEFRLVRGQHNLWASKKMISEMRRILGI